MSLTIKEVPLEERPTKSYQQKWCRYYLALEIKQGVSADVIKSLYSLSDTEYCALLRFLSRCSKTYFKPLLALTKADCVHLYDCFSSGSSERELAEKYDLTIEEVVTAIEVGEKLDKELTFNKQGPLNTLMPEKLSDQQKTERELEKIAKSKLPILLRGLD